MIPLRIAIKALDTPGLGYLLNFMDFIFLVDLVLQFFMSVTDKETQKEVD
jgi:hypothetical protein